MLESADSTLRAALTPAAATARHSTSSIPATVGAPAETVAEAVAAELHAIADQGPLRDAMRAIAPRLGGDVTGPRPSLPRSPGGTGE
jgi:hypothetical protein